MFSSFFASDLTLRSALAAITAFLACLLAGPAVIRFLTRLKVRERADKKDSAVLVEMHKGKSSTPTMGGSFVLGAILLATALFAKLDNPYVLVAMAVTIALGGAGFLDDWVKLTSPTKHGISGKLKLVLQGVVGLGAGAALYWATRERYPEATKLFIPVVRESVDLGIWFIPFVALVITASSNSVNLTDGLDGLAIGCLTVASLAYAIFTYVAGRSDWTTKYLHVPYVAGCGELTIVTIAMAGAGLGFLWYNGYPAQVFMGNTGSLPLGGLLGVVAVCAKQELVLFVVGFIFVAEALSVLIQVISFKTTGKRVFRCAPIHHHFQFMEIPESKITIRFWIVSALLAVASLATLKVG